MHSILDKIVKYSIYVLVFLLPLFFLPFSFETFDFNKQYLLFFLASLAFLAWLAKMVLVDKEIKFKRSPLDLFVLAFLFVAVLSAIFSVDKSSSLFGFYGRFSDGLIGLLSLGILYFLITNNAGIRETDAKQNAKPTRKEISVNGLIKTFKWSVFVVILFSYFSIFGIWEKINQLIALPPVMRQTIFNPVAGTMEGLAVFLAAVLVFLIGRILISGKEVEEDKSSSPPLAVAPEVEEDKSSSRPSAIAREDKKAGRIINYLLAAAILFLLIIIDFNPAWLVILLSLVLCLVFVLWKRMFKEEINKLLLPIFLVFLAAIFLFVKGPDIQGAVLKYYLPQEQVLNQGTSWSVGLGSVTENIKSGFLGSGVGTFHYDFAKFKPLEFNQNIFWSLRFDRPGSHIAELLATMGFLGLISYLALVGFFLLISWLITNSKQIPFLMFFLALLVGQFVFYQNTVLAFAFWLVLGASVVNWQSIRRPVRVENPFSLKDFPELSLIFSVLLVIFALALALLYFFAIKFYLADVNYRNYFEAGEGQKLEKAVGLNPYQSQYKLVMAGDYLGKIIREGQKPAAEIDEVALSNNIYLAITFAREASQLSPNRVAAWETLAIIYREIQGVAAGALEWGIKSLEKAISLEPTNPVLHTELGKFYFISGDSDKAKEKFNKAKELKPDYADASIQMALIYEFEDNIEEAIKQMEEVISFYPYNIEAIFQLGRLHLNNNRIDEAISQFEWAIELFPNHSNSLYSLGLAYQSKGEKEKAIAKFERVLELNPGNEDVQQKLDQLRE